MYLFCKLDYHVRNNQYFFDIELIDRRFIELNPVYEDPVVSICCVCYNHEKTLRRALDGLLAQECNFPFEILIHDDASTDHSQEIIKEYLEKYPDRIHAILQTENQYSKRISYYRKYFFPMVRGRYIAFCECDDYWCDTKKLQTQIDVLEANKSCSVCVHGSYKITLEGKKMNEVFPPVRIPESIITAEQFIDYELGQGKWMFQLASYVVRYEVLANYYKEAFDNYATKFAHVGDLPMLLYCATQGDIYYVNRYMSCYTVDSGGFMSRAYRDPEFAKSVHEAYIEGFKAYNEFTDNRYEKSIDKGIIRRKFYIDYINKHYWKILTSPDYRFILTDMKMYLRALKRLLNSTLGKVLSKK